MEKIELEESIKDWVKCWKGNTTRLLKEYSVNLQWFVKIHYQLVFDFLYRINDERKVYLPPILKVKPKQLQFKL